MLSGDFKKSHPTQEAPPGLAVSRTILCVRPSPILAREFDSRELDGPDAIKKGRPRFTRIPLMITKNPRRFVEFVARALARRAIPCARSMRVVQFALTETIRHKQ